MHCETLKLWYRELKEEPLRKFSLVLFFRTKIMPSNEEEEIYMSKDIFKKVNKDSSKEAKDTRNEYAELLKKNKELFEESIKALDKY